MTIEKLNKTYHKYLSRTCSGKGKWGWYDVTLKNGRLIVASTLKELEHYILREIKED